MQRFEGSLYFRQRLLLSTLSGKPIRIDKIRANDENEEAPGLAGNSLSHVFLS
jgi:RNA 3'-terminal phosphate cyclase-like protein